MQLAYRKLYWRMALYIGAAILAFLALGIASLVAVASYQLEDYTATKHGSLGREAASVLATGGRPALERWLRRDARIPRDVTVYVLDRESRDILGRPLPDAYAGFVRRTVVGEDERPGDNYRPVHLAPQLIAPDGAVYAFLVLPNRITPWGSLATLIGLALTAVLVVGSVAWLIARAFGRPIVELQRAVRELALGHIAARVPEAISARRDELGALAADFNAMADQLAGLLASRQQLMGELSHELRSPLARMQAALALAAHRQTLAPAESERLGREIERMDRIIADLLRFARLDVKAELARRLLRVDELLGELVRDEEVEAANRGVRLELVSSGDLVLVGDPQLLRSGFENIVRNAIRYSPTAATIAIGAARAGEQLVVTIADRGPGVPAPDLERIFEPYVRVADARGGRAEPEDGTGLGLAIARRVFEAHGGSVVASARDGGGLTLTVKLPAAERI